MALGEWSFQPPACTEVEYETGTKRAQPHDHLVVKLTAPDVVEMFLVLSGCEELMLPVFWKVIKPELVAAHPPFVDFVDERVRIRCQDASLHSQYSRPT